MKEILFATTNPRKIREANGALASFGIVAKPISIEVDEIQHRDPAEIVKAKALAAYAILQKPVVVSDTSWRIPALGGFPGGYMKDVGIWWDEKDWLAIMNRHNDKTAICSEGLAYYDGIILKDFSQDYKGCFLSEPRGPIVNKVESFERIISLNRIESLSEQISIRSIDASSFGHWEKFGTWFSESQ